MKTYRGVIQGNAVVLNQKLDVEDGTEAIVLVGGAEEKEEVIIQRQKALLKKGFVMGSLLYQTREALHVRET